MRPGIETISVFAQPASDSRPIVQLKVDPIFGLSFLLIAKSNRYQEMMSDGWAEVYLPTRPNGSKGWIGLDHVDLYENPYLVTIDLSSFSLVATRDGAIIIESAVAIGAETTPTPIGEFYITDLYSVKDGRDVYGPYAFALSGHSGRLTGFEESTGLLGLHGTEDTSSIGKMVSLGCVRVPNEVIVELASVLPLGTPVSIRH